MDFSLVKSKLLMFHLNDDDDHDSIANVLMGIGNPDGVLSFCQSLKETGNSYFRRHEFGDAYLQYHMAIKVLCFTVPLSSDGNSLYLDLAVSLNLNFAACALRNNQFSQASQLCSLVLEFDGNNIKGLFRRAAAALKLGCLPHAYDDLSLASRLDPTNREISQELDRVKNLVLSKISGDCFRGTDTCSVSSLPSLEPKCGVEASPSVYKSSLLHSGGSVKRSLDVVDVASSKKNKENSSCVSLDGSLSVPMEIDPLQGMEKPNPNVGCLGVSPDCLSTRSIPLASQNNDLDDSVMDEKRHHKFVNSRNRKSSMMVPTEALGKITSGRELQFYNPACFSFVTIRAVRVSKPILAEVLQGHESWEAEAPFQCKESPSLSHQDVSPHTMMIGDSIPIQLDPPLLVASLCTSTQISHLVVLPHLDFNPSWDARLSAQSRSSNHSATSCRRSSLGLRRSSSRMHIPNRFLFCRVKMGYKRKRVLSTTDDSYNLLRKKIYFDVAFCLFGSHVLY